jgi:hypothetical protein
MPGRSISTFARIGFGSYSSPQAKLWGAYPFNDSTSYIGVGLNLSSSAGHLKDRPSSFRYLNARAAYSSLINNKIHFKLHAGLQNDFNHPAIFGPHVNCPGCAATTSTAPIPEEDFRINQQGYHGGIVLSQLNNDVSGWKLRANIGGYNAAFNSNPIGGKINAVTYDGSFSNRWALGHPNETVSVELGGRGGSYNPNRQGSQQWGTLQGGVAYNRLFNYKTHIDIAAKIFYTSDVNKSAVYPGGRFKFDHWFANHLKVTGIIRAKPYVNTVEELHNENRFLGYNNLLIHTYAVSVTGKAQIKYYRGSKLHFGARYSNYQNFAYFIPRVISNNSQNGGNPVLDAYQVKYRNATNFRLFAGLTQQLVPRRFWLNGKIYIQHPELNNGDKIPFEENWGLKASANIRPVDRFSLQGWANYTGRRHTGFGDKKVGGFLLVGGRLDVNITKNIGVYGKLVNILNQHYQYWLGYQERPFQAYAGITIKF